MRIILRDYHRELVSVSIGSLGYARDRTMDFVCRDFEKRKKNTDLLSVKIVNISTSWTYNQLYSPYISRSSLGR